MVRLVSLAAWRRLGVLMLLVMLVADPRAAVPVAAGSPPDAPVIASPQPTNVGADDVHMEISAPFHDPDGDTHVATDWEIRTSDGATVVWAAHDSPELVHAHFSDGVFMNLPAGQRRLNYGTRYIFRVRFRDSSGDVSEWTERRFVTSRKVQAAEQQALGALVQPAPAWRSDGDSPMTLPAGARLVLESGRGEALLTLSDGDPLTVTGGAVLAGSNVVRLRLLAPPTASLLTPTSRLTVVLLQPDGVQRQTFFLPALAVPAGGAAVLWPTVTGATFYGASDEGHSSRQHLARDTELPWELEPGYRLDASLATLSLPVSLAFVPNPGDDPAAPRLYVSELYGRIKVITNDGRVFTYAENLLNVNPTGIFPGSGELGVIGVCLVPGSRDVYATMVYRDIYESLRNKLVRIVSDDGLRADRVEDLLVAGVGEGLARASHQIQQCSYGPDGKLYTYIADGPDPAVAQNDASLNGKVQRLNLDGSAPTDNPRYDPAQPTAPISYQYTKGQRNAFGMTWRQSDSSMYMSENGPNVDRLVKIVAGRNYGWDGTDESMATHALYLWPEEHWSPVGLAFVEGAAAASLPADKQGKLLVASAGLVYATGPQRGGKAIQEFTVDADGAIIGEPRTIARYIGEGKGSIADLKLQPDGIYFTDLYLDDGDGGATAPGGKLWRIRYAGQAAFSASTSTGAAPLTVT
ncbi:MAG: PQQ-dependent sugar dehydrogenase, partial [Chloroflexi bacterium]|nr:PQQ-dependent sugar dehydrogenase [Chloroflexota bacterium]